MKLICVQDCSTGIDEQTENEVTPFALFRSRVTEQQVRNQHAIHFLMRDTRRQKQKLMNSNKQATSKLPDLIS